jgi:hypothetical protein
MNKMSMTFSNVMKELQAAENIMKPHSTALLSKAPSSRLSLKLRSLGKRETMQLDQSGLGQMLSLKGSISSVARRVIGKRNAKIF